MKYLITLFLLVSLISLVSADTTFNDNPNYFLINSYTAPTGTPGLGNPGGTIFYNVSNQTMANVTLPLNITITNQTIVNQITEVIGSNPFIWIVIILFIIAYFYIRDYQKNNKKSEEVYEPGFFTTKE